MMKCKKMLSIVMVIAMVLILAATASAETVLTEGGLILTIPEKYEDLLTVDVPENDRNGVLVRVSETASIEAAGTEEDGAGWLFSIRRIDGETLRSMLCSDMSGMVLFAKDGDDGHYLYCHPTDVRLYRENNEEMQKASAQWAELNEWAWKTVPGRFVEENETLTTEEYGNTDLDIALARIAWKEGTEYTLSTTEFGPLTPEDVDPMPYLEQLTDGVRFERTDKEEAPDGEYVVLSFPGEGIRFDFFLMPGAENCIREVGASGYETLYTAVFDDGEGKASEIMQSWYDALAEQRGKKSETAATADEWRIAKETELTDEVSEMCEEAFSRLMGVQYEPLALLAERPGEGTDYCVLCRATVVYPGAEPHYVLAYLHADADGHAEARDFRDLTIAG